MITELGVNKEHEVLSLITGIGFSNVPCWYGSTRRDLKMDLIVPKVSEGHRPLPCIVWICGGAFMVVDRSVWIPEMMRFARNGFVVASIEYRTSNEEPFPAALVDCKSAVRYLRAHAEEYSIDPDRIFAMGESAGGTLASLLGTTAGLSEYDLGDWADESSAVQGVVDYYGVANMGERGGSISSSDIVPSYASDAFLGSEDRAEAGRRASAVEHVSDKTPPVMILHGTEDTLVPISQSVQFHEKLVQHGVRTEFLVLNGAAHGDDLFYQDEVTDRVIRFLRSIS